MKINADFLMRCIGGENIVIPSKAQSFKCNRIFKLSETGAFLFRSMECEMSEEELIKKLLDEYDIDAATAKQDIKALLNDFAQKGLLE